jgi:hypothetical protein
MSYKRRPVSEDASVADLASPELNEEDIEALREMSDTSRAFKGLVLGLFRLLSK